MDFELPRPSKQQTGQSCEIILGNPLYYKSTVARILLKNKAMISPLRLPLGATTHGELWPPEQSTSILLYSEADYLVPEQFSFNGVRLVVSRPTPNLEDQDILHRLAPTPSPVWHGCSYQ
jgi:hypothetical protein